MKKLTRSRTNRVIFGVCGGIGEYFTIDPVIIRIVVILLAFGNIFAMAILYVLAALIIPDEPRKKPMDHIKKEFYRSTRRPQSENTLKEAEKVDD